MPKITYIGAGSRGFAKRFLMDIMTRPALAEGTVSLMDINQENLDLTTALAKKMARQLAVPTVIESTTDRRKALEGADYVISTVLLHGIDVHDQVLQIARKYGVDQVVGCTTGPGAAFLAMRYMPFLMALLAEMEELCPHALFIHYSNPTTSVPWALNVASPIRSIGLCHSVQGTAKHLARYIGAPYSETGHWVAGVNHQAWFLRFEWQGEDAYPQLRAAMEDPEIYEQDIVRFEMMKYFGHFVTESSAHNSEYVPYFRKSRELVERFTNKRGRSAGFGLTYSNAERWKESRKGLDDTLRDEAFGEAPIDIVKSEEYCIGIINAVESNVPFRFNGNVLNTGVITNLPPGCCVEVPCLVDNMGIHPCYVGPLPPQCASLNRARIAGDELLVKGMLEGNRKAIEQAISLDPLTAAMCTLDQIHDMVEEIFEAQAPYIGEYV